MKIANKFQARFKWEELFKRGYEFVKLVENHFCDQIGCGEMWVMDLIIKRVAAG